MKLKFWFGAQVSPRPNYCYSIEVQGSTTVPETGTGFRLEVYSSMLRFVFSRLWEVSFGEGDESGS